VNSESRKKWVPLAVLVAALVVWTALLALGAYLEWGADQPRHDIRKPLIMLGSLGAFLAVWAAAFWLRSRRLRQKTPIGDDEARSGSPLE